MHVFLVGLPARGKSYIVKKLRRYLNWLQYETKVKEKKRIGHITCNFPRKPYSRLYIYKPPHPKKGLQRW